MDTPPNLQTYLDTWNLTNPQLLAETVTSHVYTVDHSGERVVLKLLTDYGHEEQVGAVALQHFDGHGAVRLFRCDAKAQLMEYIDGPDLVGMVAAGDDDGATRIIAGVLNQLHSANPEPTPGLTPLRPWFKSLFDRAEVERAAGQDTIFTRAAVLADELLSNPREERVLHGDIHHENIRLHGQRGWVAFDPKGLYGERSYDAANTLCNPIKVREIIVQEGRLERQVRLLAGLLNIEEKRLMQFVYVYGALSWIWLESVDIEAVETRYVAEQAERLVREWV